MVDFSGHVGYLLLFIGTWLITNRNPVGFALRAFGEVIWLAIGVHLGLSSVVLWGCVFCVLEVRGFYKWTVSD